MARRESSGERRARGAPRRLVLAGRLTKLPDGTTQIELTDGLAVDVMPDDYTILEEKTDPATQRAVVTIELKGSKPVTAIMQPHYYRVLAEAGVVPFAFNVVSGAAHHDAMNIGMMARAVAGGGSGGANHDTSMMSSTWFGTQKDGTKPDSASEPDEIYL